MRLSLLARKLSVKPSEISDELHVKGEKPLHGNSKLTEEQIEEIIRLFGPLPEEVVEPEFVEEPSTDPLVESSETDTLPVEIQTPESPADLAEPSTSDESHVLDVAPDVIVETKISVSTDEIEEGETVESETGVINETAEDEPEIEEVEAPSLEDVAPVIHSDEAEESLIEAPTSNGHTVEQEADQEENSDKVEVLVSELLEDPDEALLENPDVLIKAPKVHLPGLTVKGKIDLPEPKPKPEKETTDQEEDQQEDTRGRRGRHRGKRRKQSNPVAAARMREERQAERRKKAQLAEEKERKRKHYQTNIQAKAAPPPKKKSGKKSDSQEQVSSQSVPTGKMNALQRFWKWMNT